MPREIILGELKIGPYHKPAFIAEIGINHNGDPLLARDMAHAAIDSGADIIKFQHHLPEFEMTGNHGWMELMRECQLELETLSWLQQHIEKSGKVFLCTPFCREAADELDWIEVLGFKTGSGELSNTPLLQHIARFNKPMLISTGMSTREELIRTLDAVRKINGQVILLNCTSTYPATPTESRLQRIGWLRSTFNLPVGQSDHTPTISTALGAIACGAVVIEKHFTLDRSLPGPDQSASVTPSEFKQLVRMGLEIWEGMQLCVEADMGVLDGEWKVREIAQHSIVATKDILKGEKLSTDNMWVMRPGTGVPAYLLDKAIGTTATYNIAEGELLDWMNIR